MYLFEALLHERRIIVLGKSLAMLSTCVHAIANMVFPFTWQVRTNDIETHVPIHYPAKFPWADRDQNFFKLYSLGCSHLLTHIIL
jgi:hypothetical protein